MEKKVQISLGARTDRRLAGGKGIAKTKLQAVNNAGLTALLADFLGPAGIILTGMDLAQGGRGNGALRLNTGRSHVQIDKVHFHKVPGNFEASGTHAFSLRLAGDFRVDR